MASHRRELVAQILWRAVGHGECRAEGTVDELLDRSRYIRPGSRVSHEVLVAQVEQGAEHTDAQGAAELHGGVIGGGPHARLGCGQRTHD